MSSRMDYADRILDAIEVVKAAEVVPADTLEAYALLIREGVLPDLGPDYLRTGAVFRSYGLIDADGYVTEGAEVRLGRMLREEEARQEEAAKAMDRELAQEEATTSAGSPIDGKEEKGSDAKEIGQESERETGFRVVLLWGLVELRLDLKGRDRG